MIYGNTQSLFYKLFYELILNPKLEYYNTTGADYCHAADMAMAPPTASLAKGKADARGNTQSRLHLSSARQSYVSW